MIFDESFPKCCRITTVKDIEAIKESEKKLRGRYVIVLFRKTDLGFARIVVVASSRVGNALMRNRLKRIIREIFRKDLKNKGSYDFMVIVRKSAPGALYNDIRDDLLSLLDPPGVNYFNG